MFWTVGPAAVGKATLAGWKEALRPGLAEPGRRYAIWPFDGTMSELLENSDAVIVETYPTEAYRQLDLRMGTPGMAKARQDDRRADTRRMLEWCADNAVIPRTAWSRRSSTVSARSPEATICSTRSSGCSG